MGIYDSKLFQWSGKLFDFAKNVKDKSVPINRKFVTDSNQIAVKQFIGNRIANVAFMSTLWHGVYNTPDVMLGMLPLFKVQTLDISRSLGLLEYRSVHGEFLAHQRGGRLGVRIDADLTGATGPFILAVLRSLALVQEEENIDRSGEIKTLGTPTTKSDKVTLNKLGTYKHGVNRWGNWYQYSLNPNNPRANTYRQGSLRQQYGGIYYEHDLNGDFESRYQDDYNGNDAFEKKVTDKMSANTYDDYVMLDDVNYEKVPYHRTFTFMHQDFFIFDAFIETLSWKREIRDGKDVIKVIIMLREYIPPPIAISEQEVNLRFYSANRRNSTVKRLKKVKYQKRIKASKITKNANWTEMIDLIINAGYRTVNYFKRYRGLYYKQSNSRIAGNGNMYDFIVDMNFKSFGTKNLGELRRDWNL